MKELKSLYNGIINDYSIQRNTLGWREIIEILEKRYKYIKKTDEQFTNQMVYDALEVAKGKLYIKIENFAGELQMYLESLHDKKRNGTQKSPFDLWS